jgi:uncharacterized protein YecT (DUF1311 family)
MHWQRRRLITRATIAQLRTHAEFALDARSSRASNIPSVKTTILTVSLLFAFLALCLPTAHGQSQSEMNRQAEADFVSADAALNKAYQKLVTKLDEQSVAKLKTAQRAWIAFRDAQAALAADVAARGGSMAPMIYAGTRATLTKVRTKDLEKLLEN